MHNSCQLLHTLFLFCDPVNLTFDLTLIGGRDIVMDYPCDKFGNFSLSRFSFIMRTNTQTSTHRESHTDTAERYTHTTTVIMSK